MFVASFRFMESNVVVGSQPSSTAYLPAASNMRVLSCFLLTLVTIISDNHADAARILGVFPTPSKSHWILGSSLLKELASDGHEVRYKQ